MITSVYLPFLIGCRIGSAPKTDCDRTIARQPAKIPIVFFVMYELIFSPHPPKPTDNHLTRPQKPHTNFLDLHRQIQKKKKHTPRAFASLTAVDSSYPGRMNTAPPPPQHPEPYSEPTPS